PYDIVRHVGESWPADPESLMAATREALRDYAASGFMARVLLATWWGEPQLWVAGTDDCAGEGAFNPSEILHYVSTGNDLPAFHRAIRRGLTPSRMARVIDAQLVAPAVLAAGAAGAAGYRVQYGGSVVEIEVSESGVESRVLREIPADAGG